MKAHLLAMCLTFLVLVPDAVSQIPVPNVPADQQPEIAVLKAQLDTMKQFQDSFMSMAQWTLGSAIAVALAMGAFAWYSSKTNYERDKEFLQREVVNVRSELRVQLRSDLEHSIQDSIQNAFGLKTSRFDSRIDEVEDEVLVLKERALEQDAKEAAKAGNYCWAVRGYCDLLQVYVKRQSERYFAGDVLDKLRDIARNPAATLDADTVAMAAEALSKLPKAHSAAVDSLISGLKERLL